MNKKTAKIFILCAVLCMFMMFTSISSLAYDETTTVKNEETTTQAEEETTAPNEEETTEPEEETTTKPEEPTTKPEEPTTKPVVSGFISENGALYYYLPESGKKFIPEKAGAFSFGGKAYLFSSNGSVIKYSGKSFIDFGKEKYCISKDNSLLCGLQKNDGKTYYFDEKTYVMKKGWVTHKDGKKRYFDSKGVMLTGYKELDGKFYSFGSDGVMQTGWVDFKEGRRRFHLKTGAMLTGFKTFSGNSYYFNKNGIMQTGWVNFKNGTRRFHLKTGAMLKGKKSVSGKYYYFNDKGFRKNGWVTIGKDKYYFSKKNNVMVTGWNDISGKRYYFYSSGKMAKNAIVGSNYLLSDGTKAQSNAVKLAVQAVKSATNSKMTKEQKLKACYNWIIKSFYYERDYQDPARLTYNWTKTYAEYSLSRKRGNCYKYASAMGYCAEILGYEARVAYGKIASGSSRVNHGWTEIKIDGKYYIFDTVQADHYKGNYYQRTYGNYPKKLYKSGAKAIVLS